MRWILLSLALLFHGAYAAAPPDDPHYVESGFFDIHVCNWPNRPLFLMSLFSTTRHDEIAEIQVHAPSGKLVSTLDLTRYRRVPQSRGEKRVFINMAEIPSEREEGWYKARVRLKNGRTQEARDRVELKSLPIASGLQPVPGAEDIPLPKELRWAAIPGARFYQVFIKDAWADGKLILQSSFLMEPRLLLPQGLLKPGGSYLWQVHARDMNEDPVWGDFNLGSLTPEVAFSVAD